MLTLNISQSHFSFDKLLWETLLKGVRYRFQRLSFEKKRHGIKPVGYLLQRR